MFIKSYVYPLMEALLSINNGGIYPLMKSVFSNTVLDLSATQF